MENKLQKKKTWLSAKENLHKNQNQLTRHADTSEGARIIETRPIVPAGVTLALIDVGLTSRSGETHGAVASERSWRVHADAVVFTW